MEVAALGARLALKGGVASSSELARLVLSSLRYRLWRGHRSYGSLHVPLAPKLAATRAGVADVGSAPGAPNSTGGSTVPKAGDVVGAGRSWPFAANVPQLMPLRAANASTGPGVGVLANFARDALRKTSPRGQKNASWRDASVSVSGSVNGFGADCRRAASIQAVYSGNAADGASVAAGRAVSSQHWLSGIRASDRVVLHGRAAPVPEPRVKAAQNSVVMNQDTAPDENRGPSAQEANGGDVFLDGEMVGRWIDARLSRNAGRPGSGPSFFNGRQSPI